MPPRASTAELLSSLVYLEPHFDPATLTVAQLTGLLQAHDIDTRVASNKTGLIALFNTEIAMNRTPILAKRQRDLTRSPKANGIRDGVTGQLVDGAAEEDVTPPRPRGRRSSAAPASTSTSRRRAFRMSAAAHQEQEEELEEPEPEPTSPQTGRKSRIIEEAAFSDENVFQMGSSSPDPPVETYARRRSQGPVASSSTPISSAGGRRSVPANGARDSPTNPFTKAVDTGAGFVLRTKKPLPSSDPTDEEPEEGVLSIRGKLDDRKSDALATINVTERQALIRPATVAPVMLLILLWLLVFQFARSSAKLGFCDRDSSTNAVLDERLEQLNAGERCMTEGKTDCPPIPLFPPFMQPLSCTPCPDKANCDIKLVTCDAPLILKRHPLSALNPVLDGYPGLGPVAFPPTCVEDESRKKLLTNAGRWIIERLQRYRGEQICYGREPRSIFSPSDIPWKWAGVKKSEIKHMMSETHEGKSLGPERLDEVFSAALSELEDRKFVVSGRDEEGEDWVTAVQAKMSAGCKVRVWMRRLWEQAKIYVIAFAAVIASSMYVRRRLYFNRQTTALAHSMLPSTLSVLQRTGGIPLLSTQLRDSILSYEPNLKRRKEIWERVEKIVEMNANVRVGEEEVGGEVGRGWRWVGPPDMGDGTPSRREIKY
ncbi:hypothetical protein DACRYDRAFT_113805 [Dacryopinax primogenitus]|uniref:Man1/Src1-like C-terminal domain-containing protein n=1 Tax=Dacryopinax primogenitus (strain DJM 731) TaxID=1858805 RepID=M5GBI6_DACPD|nr:uncharacterized protein DACRYDRAFT_113805 [Dacryopinax primogenitus]EJU05760.1 hypothetical protein DACRYDRAFT_113805 [Dacryopinax primogenitus]